jgi:hypothetical protein
MGKGAGNRINWWIILLVSKRRIDMIFGETMSKRKELL